MAANGIEATKANAVKDTTFLRIMLFMKISLGLTVLLNLVEVSTN
jgi:hypothetical protein